MNVWLKANEHPTQLEWTKIQPASNRIQPTNNIYLSLSTPYHCVQYTYTNPPVVCPPLLPQLECIHSNTNSPLKPLEGCIGLT